jgi:hypothetical protein
LLVADSLLPEGRLGGNGVPWPKERSKRKAFPSRNIFKNLKKRNRGERWLPIVWKFIDG